MWLVLCETQDVAAQWAYLGLLARGVEPLELITSTNLAQAVCWEHRLGNDGVLTTVTLADGRHISSSDVHGALNRLLTAPSALLPLARPSEKAYASQELVSFFLSWLYSLPGPVLNRPTPQGLSGQWRHLSEWVWLSAKAGLPVSPYVVSADAGSGYAPVQMSLAPPDAPVRTVLLVGNQVVGDSIPEAIAEGCRRLGQLANTALLGIDFAANPEGYWTFTSATPLPDLRQGGEVVLDAMAAKLTGG